MAAPPPPAPPAPSAPSAPAPNISFILACHKKDIDTIQMLTDGASKETLCEYFNIACIEGCLKIAQYIYSLGIIVDGKILSSVNIEILLWLDTLRDTILYYDVYIHKAFWVACTKGNFELANKIISPFGPIKLKIEPDRLFKFVCSDKNVSIAKLDWARGCAPAVPIAALLCYSRDDPSLMCATNRCKCKCAAPLIARLVRDEKLCEHRWLIEKGLK